MAQRAHPELAGRPRQHHSFGRDPLSWAMHGGLGLSRVGSDEFPDASSDTDKAAYLRTRPRHERCPVSSSQHHWQIGWGPG